MLGLGNTAPPTDPSFWGRMVIENKQTASDWSRPDTLLRGLIGHWVANGLVALCQSSDNRSEGGGDSAWDPAQQLPVTPRFSFLFRGLAFISYFTSFTKLFVA